jgi:YggT family protein
MDANYLTNPLIFLIEVILGLYALLVMLRFLLQKLRADFYNPLSQFIIKLTTPALNPLRRIIPGFAGMDISSLALAWLVTALQLWLVLILGNPGSVSSTSLLLPLLLAIPELIQLTINIFLFAIIIQAVLSWFGNAHYNPAYSFLNHLTEPLLRPARRMIPAISGIDLSPMAVMLGLILLKMLLIPPIRGLALVLGNP